MWKCLHSTKFRESLDSEVRPKQTQLCSVGSSSPQDVSSARPGWSSRFPGPSWGLEAGLFPDGSVPREGAASGRAEPLLLPQVFISTGSPVPCCRRDCSCESHLPFWGPEAASSIQKAATADPGSEAQESVRLLPLNGPSTPMADPSITYSYFLRNLNKHAFDSWGLTSFVRCR